MFQAEWAAAFNTPPLSSMLRDEDKVPWIRFHSLPGSKRYATDASEQAIILERANAIGDRVLGSGNACWRIEARADDAPGAGEFVDEFRESEDPDDVVWRFYVRPVIWRAGDFDFDFKTIADDRPYRAIWMSRRDHALLAPYDGGFDVFPSSSQEAERLRAEFGAWLSLHPAGL